MSMGTMIGKRSDDLDLDAYQYLGDLHRVVQHLDAICDAHGVNVFTDFFANVEQHREEIEERLWSDDLSSEENQARISQELAGAVNYFPASTLRSVFELLLTSLTSETPRIKTMLHKGGSMISLESVLVSLREGIAFLENESSDVHLIVDM